MLAILFVDLGLTLDQFVLLNLIWAATIFLFEVPSGALADTLGRRKLLVAASVLMVVEMLCLLFAPRGGGALLFGLCIVNRICSGLSEACASGADEALAYDSLPASELPALWDKLMAATMRWRSIGFVIAMVLGGLIYQPGPLNRLLPGNFQLTSDLAHRLPVLVVLGQALVCLGITLRMVEPPMAVRGNFLNSCRDAVKLTLTTARWVFTHPPTLVVITLGMGIDCITRNFATVNSSYYQLIKLPEWSFGFIGSAIGVIGYFVPTFAKRLNERFSRLTNLGIAAVLALIGLSGLIPAWPIFGLLPAILLFMTMGLLGFTLSRALHAEADSAQRATVLSVKGLAFNLGYGLFSLGFSRLLAHFPDHPAGNALRQALFWQVPAYALGISVLFLWGNLLLRKHRA